MPWGGGGNGGLRRVATVPKATGKEAEEGLTLVGLAPKPSKHG